MAQQLMALMRYENAETTMRYCVGHNAATTADAAWQAYERQNSNDSGNNGLLGSAVERVQEHATPCAEINYAVRPAGLEPATSGLEIGWRVCLKPKVPK
jgi:hypothetical protein